MYSSFSSNQGKQNRLEVGAVGYANFSLVTARSSGLFSFFLVLDPMTTAWDQGSYQHAGMMYADHISDKHQLFCKLPLPALENSSQDVSPKAFYKMILLLMMARVCHPPKRHSD